MKLYVNIPRGLKTLKIVALIYQFRIQISLIYILEA
jgi:hypothetical protein